MALPLFDASPDVVIGPHFDGRTYEPKLDHARLGSQLQGVYEVLKRGGWHTLASLATAVGGTEASVSARLRDLRKDKFGGFTVERRRVADSGLHEYRLVTTGQQTDV